MANPSLDFLVDTFMDKIWGYDTESDIRLFGFIFYIRKKLVSLWSNMK